MASKGKQSDKSKYPSRYAPDTFITAQQYAIEIICERLARYNKQDLCVYFWKTKDWASTYKRWLRVVHKVSKEYSAEAIIRALKDKRAGMRWSIHSDFMLNLIKEHQELIIQEKNRIAESKPIQIDEHSGDTFREHKIDKRLQNILDL